MRVILSVITFLMVYHYSSGQSMHELCASMMGDNQRIEYSPHNTDCDKFIQCRYTQEGVLQGEIRQCAFSTYWNNEDWTCTPANYTYCPNDRCNGQANGVQYDGEGNCRGYWSCMDGKSVASCCPQGQYFNETLGCIDNDDNTNCTATCLSDVVVSKNETRLCNMKAVPGEPTKYQLEIAGFGPINMPCAQGTTFVEKECGCVANATVDDRKPKCTREVYLPFDNDERDMSGKRNHVGNKNVIIENGVARFNGKDSHLTIQRFNNIGQASTVVIKVNYTSDHSKPGIARAIVSNSGRCSSVPSVLLSEDSTNVNFGVGTTTRSFASTHLAHDDMLQVMGIYSKKSVVYKYNGAYLSGSDGYNTTATPVSGRIRNVHCPIYVGVANELAPFEGEIDAIEIYLCDPDM